MASRHTQEYLALLQRQNSYLAHVRSVQEVGDAVVQEVRRKLQVCRTWMNPPIRLAPVAEEFLIQRRPEQSGESGRGYIEFDSAKQRFVIYLNRSQDQHGRTVATDATDRRDRFVYAHEFAHRFFFVRVGDGWSRALGEIVRQAHPTGRYRIARAVSQMEERICNSVATRLLVPREQLERVVEDAIERHTSTEHLLIDTLTNASKRFQVSWWCAIRRITAVRPVALASAWGSSFCFVLLGESVHTGAGRGRSALRVLDFWWPQEIGGEPVKPAFPGLRVSHLGDEFAARASTLGRRGEGSRQAICWPIRFISKDRRPMEAVFRGYCRTWSVTVEKRYLLYGTVSSSSGR